MSEYELNEAMYNQQKEWEKEQEMRNSMDTAAQAEIEAEEQAAQEKQRNYYLNLTDEGLEEKLATELAKCEGFDWQELKHLEEEGTFEDGQFESCEVYLMRAKKILSLVIPHTIEQYKKRLLENETELRQYTCNILNEAVQCDHKYSSIYYANQIFNKFKEVIKEG